MNITDRLDELEYELDFALRDAKAVRKRSTLVVQEIARIRDNLIKLQSEEDTSSNGNK